MYRTPIFRSGTSQYNTSSDPTSHWTLLTSAIRRHTCNKPFRSTILILDPVLFNRVVLGHNGGRSTTRALQVTATTTLYRASSKRETCTDRQYSSLRSEEH